MARKGIDPDTLYVIIDDNYIVNGYAITPDGVGMYWYDTKEEAEGGLPEVYETRYVTDKQLQDMREF